MKINFGGMKDVQNIPKLKNFCCANFSKTNLDISIIFFPRMLILIIENDANDTIIILLIFIQQRFEEIFFFTNRSFNT